MEYRKLGRTGLDVSVICLGTMTWGRQNTEDEGHEQMDYALEQGVNFFDTAEMYAVPTSAETYGRTEEIIGAWFAARKNREKVILATKVAGAGISWIRGGDYKIDRRNIKEAIENSLKRLQTDYIDLYQLHWPNREHYHFGRHWNFSPEKADAAAELDGFLENLETLEGLTKAGKIRHVGLSNETAWGMMQYLKLSEEKSLPRPVSIQNEYSLLCRIFEPDLSEIAVHENIGLLAYSPLAAGALSGKYLDGKMPKGSRRTMLSSPSHRDTKQTDDAIKAYVEIAEKHGLDMCQMALSFVNAQPFVTSNIIGATSMEQLKTNIDSIHLKLNGDVLKAIDTVYRQFPLPY